MYTVPACIPPYYMYPESEEADEHHDKETLLLTVEALKAQLEEQTRLCKEQVYTCIHILLFDVCMCNFIY